MYNLKGRAGNGARREDFLQSLLGLAAFRIASEVDMTRCPESRRYPKHLEDLPARGSGSVGRAEASGDGALSKAALHHFLHLQDLFRGRDVMRARPGWDEIGRILHDLHPNLNVSD